MKSRIVSILLACVIIFSTAKVEAFGLQTPFAGKIYFTFICTCEIPGTTVLYITGTPKILVAKYIPLVSTLYKLYLPYIGANVVGNSVTTPQTCAYYVGNSCSSFTVKNLIRQIGTSRPGLF